VPFSSCESRPLAALSLFPGNGYLERDSQVGHLARTLNVCLAFASLGDTGVSRVRVALKGRFEAAIQAGSNVILFSVYKVDDVTAELLIYCPLHAICRYVVALYNVSVVYQSYKTRKTRARANVNNNWHQ